MLVSLKGWVINMIDERHGGPCVTRRGLIRAGLGVAGLGACAALAPLMAPTSVAAATLVPKRVDYTRGVKIDYDNFFTRRFKANGEEAYCLNPRLDSPSSGEYRTTSPAVPDDPEAAVDWNVERLRACLWFGYGGPGFDRSMFPSKWYDGSAMDADRYRQVTHIAVSFCWTRATDQATYGCTEEFNEWVRRWVTGVVDTVPVYDDAFVRLAYDHRDELPGTDVFQTYIIGGDGFQNVISFVYEPRVDIPVQKVWKGDADYADNRPSSVRLTLTGSDKSKHYLTVKSPNYKGTFEGLDPSLTYTLAEASVPGYTSVVKRVSSSDIEKGFTVTNTLETTERSVRKVWTGDERAPEYRPDEVTVTLVGSDGSRYPATLSEANGWSHTWTGLIKTLSDGTEVEYSVEEEAVEFYESTVESTGERTFAVHNELPPGKVGGAMKAPSQGTWI